MHYRCAGVAFLALCLSYPSHAQAPAAALSAAPPIPEVAISARAGVDDTASKTIITGAQIRGQGAGNVLDVLKRVPGITVVGGLRMRGLGEGFVQILLNGEPAPPGFAIDSLSPEALERIEIARSASAEHGARGIAGSINLVLRRTVSKARRDLRIGLAGDNGRPALDAALTMAERTGSLSSIVTGGVKSGRSARDTWMTEQVDGLRNEASQTDRTDRGRSESLDAAPRLTWQLPGGHTVGWQSFAQYQRLRNLGLAAVEGLDGLAPPYDALATHSSTSTGIARSSVNWLLRLDRQASLDLTLSLSAARRHQQARFTGTPAAPGAPLHQDVSRRSTDKGLTGKGKYSLPAIEGHTLVLGWEGAHNGRDEMREQTRRTGQTAPLYSASTSAVTVRRLAAFAQDEWTLARGWSAYLGLRWEQVRTASVEPGAAGTRNAYAVYSPIAQALWKLPDSPGSQVRLSLARTYEAPSPQTLIGRRIEAADNKATSPDYQGNPALRPTLSWGADLGASHSIGAGVTVSGNAYARRLRDIAVRSLRLIDGRWVAMMSNSGGASLHGMDLDVRVAHGFARGPLASAELRAGLARNWSRVHQVRGPHNRLDGQVPASATLGIDAPLRAFPVELGGSYSFQAGGTVAASDDERTWTSASRVLDLHGVWTLDQRSRMRLALSDALAQPREIVTTLREGGNVQVQSVRSAANRTLRLSWEYSGW